MANDEATITVKLESDDRALPQGQATRESQSPSVTPSSPSPVLPNVARQDSSAPGGGSAAPYPAGGFSSQQPVTPQPPPSSLNIASLTIRADDVHIGGPHGQAGAPVAGQSGLSAWQGTERPLSAEPINVTAGDVHVAPPVIPPIPRPHVQNTVQNDIYPPPATISPSPTVNVGGPTIQNQVEASDQPAKVDPRLAMALEKIGEKADIPRTVATVAQEMRKAPDTVHADIAEVQAKVEQKQTGPTAEDMFARKMAWEARDLEKLKQQPVEGPQLSLDPDVLDANLKAYKDRQARKAEEAEAMVREAQEAKARSTLPIAAPVTDEEAMRRKIREQMAQRERQATMDQLRVEMDPVYAKQQQEKQIREESEEAKKRKTDSQRAAFHAANILSNVGSAVGGTTGRLMGLAGMAAQTFPQTFFGQAAKPGPKDVGGIPRVEPRPDDPVSEKDKTTADASKIPASAAPSTLASAAKTIGSMAKAAPVAGEAAAGTEMAVVGAGAGAGAATAGAAAGEASALAGAGTLGASLAAAAGPVALVAAAAVLASEALKGMRSEVVETAERLAPFHTGLAGKLAEREMQSTQRDIDRAGRFGNDWERLLEKNNQIDQKIGRLVDTVTPLIIKAGDMILSLFSNAIDNTTEALKMMIKILSAILEAISLIPGLQNLALLQEVRDMIRQMRDETAPQGDLLAQFNAFQQSVERAVANAAVPVIGQGAGAFPAF